MEKSFAREEKARRYRDKARMEILVNEERRAIANEEREVRKLDVRMYDRMGVLRYIYIYI